MELITIKIVNYFGGPKKLNLQINEVNFNLTFKYIFNPKYSVLAHTCMAML